MSIFSKPKVTPPPSTPTKADASVYRAGTNASRGYSSLIGNSGGTGGLKRKANVGKTTLIGGA